MITQKGLFALYFKLKLKKDKFRKDSKGKTTFVFQVISVIGSIKTGGLSPYSLFGKQIIKTVQTFFKNFDPTLLKIKTFGTAELLVLLYSWLSLSLLQKGN